MSIHYLEKKFSIVLFFVLLLCLRGMSQSPTTTGFITDYGGFWQTSVGSVNTVRPDNSHHLLAFTYNDITYSTGVNNSVLTNNSIVYTPAIFKALPVAAISGITASGGSRFLAAGALVDGSPTGYVAGVARFTIKEALIDGIQGLDMGTGITNLPPTANMTFQIYNIDGDKISDAEPDLVLTQIADPASANDEFTLIDADGNTVGTTFMQNMNLLPELGRYTLDLFSFPVGIPYNTARPNGITAGNTNTSRPLRLVALRLADFGITPADAPRIKALRITPSGNSDYAFIAYNANAINLPPNAALSPETSVSSVCAGGTASLEIVGTPAAGGLLSYTWERSTDNGTSWQTVTDGGNISGATSNRLTVSAATPGHLYRSTVHETDNGNAGISGVFTIADASGISTLPSNVTISGGGAVCASATHQFLATVTGGSNLIYQWQRRSGAAPFETIAGANTANHIPVTTQAGVVDYRLVVSNGAGCPGINSNTITVSIDGITGVTPAQRCQAGQVNLSATASSGTINWYDGATSGTLLYTGTNYAPTITTSTTYYVQSSGCTERIAVTATVYPPSAAGILTRTPGNEAGTTLLTISSQTGNVLKWQSSTDNFTTNITDIAHTQSQLTVSNSVINTSYRAVVQNGNCAVAYSGTATILPFRPNSLVATATENEVVLRWQTYDQQQVIAYDIQRSRDGMAFDKIGAVPPHPSLSYTFTDSHAGSGRFYYRIREVGIDGQSVYSDIASITIERAPFSLQVYPNPVAHHTLQLRLTYPTAGSYIVSLFNTTGQQVYTKRIQHTQGSSQHVLLLPAQLAPAIYRLKVSNREGQRFTQNLFIR